MLGLCFEKGEEPRGVPVAETENDPVPEPPLGRGLSHGFEDVETPMCELLHSLYVPTLHIGDDLSFCAGKTGEVTLHMRLPCPSPRPRSLDGTQAGLGAQRRPGEADRIGPRRSPPGSGLAAPACPRSDRGRRLCTAWAGRAGSPLGRGQPASPWLRRAWRLGYPRGDLVLPPPPHPVGSRSRGPVSHGDPNPPHQAKRSQAKGWTFLLQKVDESYLA